MIKQTETENFYHFLSPFLALVCAKEYPMLAFLGIESGGRTDCHRENNLLVPGLGASPKGLKPPSLKSKVNSKLSKNSISYLSAKKQGVWKVRIKNDKSFAIDVNAGAENLPEFAFRPEIAPPTIWSAGTNFKNKQQKDPAPAFLKLDALKNEYELPLLIHFPGYGMLSVKSKNKIKCIEKWVPDKNMQGLNLSYSNTRNPAWMKAYHHGQIMLTFQPEDSKLDFSLEFQVEEERSPIAPGCDFSDKKWDGLRRCWMNTFTLDRHSLTMGDNILLGGTGHLAIHFKSDMSLLTPQLMPGLTIHAYFKRALDYTLTQAVADSGDINWVYLNPEKRSKTITDGFTDCPASNLIAFANFYQATDDKTFVKKHLATIAKTANFILSQDKDGDGILELPFHGNKFAEARTRNWWDNFAFGWKDAYYNILAYRALKQCSPIFREFGMSEIADKLDSFVANFAKIFDKVFFNPETGVYAGWISKDGKIHDYLFTFVSSMAINQGLVPKAKAAKILKMMLKKMNELGYDFKYGVPGNLVPVAPEDTIDWDAMGRWGVYENGGLCGQTAYHFIQALYATGMRKEADHILFTMLNTFENEATHSGVFPGYNKSVDWRTKEGLPCGYNYLADNYYFLLAAVTGHYGKILVPAQD